jgi:two-component system sensor histidine kinase DctS
MPATVAPVVAPEPAPPAPRQRRHRRLALWLLLVALLVVAQSLLVVLAIGYENNRAQEQADAAAIDATADLRQKIARHQQNLLALLWNDPSPQRTRADAEQLLRASRDLLRIERRTPQGEVADAVDSPFQEPVFTLRSRAELGVEAELACQAAARLATPVLSRSYFVPLPGGLGVEVADLCVPHQRAGRDAGFAVATIALVRVLEELAQSAALRGYEISLVEGDGTRLARAGQRRGTGVFVAERLVDLPGATLQLRVDSAAGRPGLIPNLPVALVLGLSLLLFAVVALLVRDGRRRAAAESRLAEALAFRKAMEDSLVTGLRARDLAGRITYVNPAFCEMVGWSAAELMAQPTPAYWPPESVNEYAARQAERHRDGGTGPESRTGFETAFVRRNGERFPVLIFEAPLVDGNGTHTGWMSAVLDISAQRRVEEVSRQQQERLAATARLATVGEMASLLGHELNQPLAAIASYATGSLNLIDDAAAAGDPARLRTVPRQAENDELRAMLRQALVRIAEQAERAGKVIKSVHDFVRRREQPREAIGCRILLDTVLPLVRLQAHKSGAQVVVDLPEPPPRVLCDRTMVEQVLLNLTRNGLQAMESATPPGERVLTLRVRQTHPRWVTFSVADRGPGIAPEVARRLFTPFFTTRAEGMGLGLSLCRTVIEQHGGALDFGNLDPGTEFRFTLPAAAVAARAPPAAAEPTATEP